LTDAINALERYVESSTEDDAAHSDAIARLASIQQRIALTGIRIAGGIEGSAIYVDDREWGRTPRPDKIFVKPGTHKVVIKHEGYNDFVSNVVVPAGQVAEVVIDMREENSPPAPTGTVIATTPADSAAATPPPATVQPEPSQADSSDRDSGDNSLVWFIVSGALAAGALTTTVWWVDRGSALGECDENGFYCENESSISGQRDMAAAFTVVLGVGAIGALIVGILELSGNTESESPIALSCLSPGRDNSSCKRSSRNKGLLIRF
jgi:hypothetical protein